MAELLDAVITAHGGLDRWNAVRSVDVTFNFSGRLLDLKSFPGHHRPTASVDVKRPRLVLQRLDGDPDECGSNVATAGPSRSDPTPAPLLPATFGRRPGTGCI